jgi:hypothetical protein
MEVLYYVVYNPLRKRKARLEVYKLENGEYQLLKGEPVWLAELNLGIGRERGIYQGIEREWLYWYDEVGNRYLTPEERLQQSQNETLAAQQRVKQLEAKLKSLGIEPNSLYLKWAAHEYLSQPLDLFIICNFIINWYNPILFQQTLVKRFSQQNERTIKRLHDLGCHLTHRKSTCGSIANGM